MMKTLNEDLVTKEKSTILAHDGPGRAPQTAIEGFGRKLGHIGGHMSITGRESGSPDGTFPLEKVTLLMWARCGHEKMKERMKKVNGKP